MGRLSGCASMSRVDDGFRRLRPVCGEAATERATATAAALLAPVASASPLCFSHLTAGGFPVEFAFRSGGRGIRFTTEVSGPDTPPAARMNRAIEVVGGIDTDVETSIRAMHAGQRLRWGAWVGVHATDSGAATKAYFEVPEPANDGAMALVSSRLGRQVAVGERPIVVRMVGVQPSSAAVEVYCRIIGLRPWELRCLLEPLGLAHRERDVLDLLEDAFEGALHRRMPGEVFGFSYAWAEGRDPAFTLYTFASTMFGGDGRTRRQMLRLACRRGWTLDDYERFTRPLEGVEGSTSTHGMFGVAVSRQSECQVTLGVAAVEDR